MWVCSRKVEAVLLATFVLFLSPAMPNMDRNTDRNNTSTRYKAIIQFWRLSIANQGKSNIDKNTCEPLKVVSHLRPSPNAYTHTHTQACTHTQAHAHTHTHTHKQYVHSYIHT